MERKALQALAELKVKHLKVKPICTLPDVNGKGTGKSAPFQVQKRAIDWTPKEGVLQ